MAASTAGSPSSFLGLPVELRLKIYDYVFVPSQQVFVIDHNLNSLCSCRTGRTFDDIEANHWWVYAQNSMSRRKYLQVGDSPLAMFVHSDSLPDLALLRVSRRVHHEATGVAYAKLDFDFEKSLPSVISFLEKIGPLARAAIRELHLSPSPPEKIHCWDEMKIWKETCAYISHELRLKTLHLHFTYLAGKQWSSVEWRQQLAMDERGCLKNKVIQETLETASHSTIGYVAALNPRTGFPQCQDFLEMLPIESPAEEKRLLKTDPSGEQPAEPILQSLVRIKELKQIKWTIKGGLSRRTRTDLQNFMGVRMIEREQWLKEKSR